LKGDVDTAIRLLTHGAEAGQAPPLPIWLAFVGTDLGMAYALAGRRDEALAWLERVVEQAVAMRGINRGSVTVRSLAEAYLLGERSQEARLRAEQALALT